MNDPQNASITIPVSLILESRLKEVAKLSKKSEQQLIREAVEMYLRQFPPQKNCYDLAQELGIIGSATDLPSDLSTNPDYPLNLTDFWS